MNRLKLTLLSEIKARRLEAFWRTEGVPVTVSTPDPFSEVLFFTADEDWQGIINLGEWFSHVAPDMAGLSSKMYDNLKLKQLFSATKRPIDMPKKTLSYKKLRLQPLPDDGAFLKNRYCAWKPLKGRFGLQNYLKWISRLHIGLKNLMYRVYPFV